MLLALIVALVLVGAAVTLFARAAALPRMRTGESLGQIGAYGYADGSAPEAASERPGPLAELAARLGDILLRGSSRERQDETRRLLLSAGAWKLSPATLAGYRALAAIMLGSSFVWLGSVRGVPPLLLVVAAPYITLVGWRVPIFVLKSRAGRRIERIEIELPELIDLLVVTLEAGLAFNAALQRSAERMHGPLGEELRLTLREQNLGLSLQESLGNFLERCDAPAVRAFVRAVAQGEAMGISIGQVMRELAGDLRTRRRQIIEEKAQKAPIKMLFPLALLILPATVVIVLFPGLYSIVETLGGGL